jgi:hypothetical protein
MSDIYYQSQTGGLCRLHSLNGYFEEPRISQEQFSIYQNDYDIIYSKKFNSNTSCISFDLVGSDQTTLVSYILKQNGIYSKYIALNEIYQKPKNTILTRLCGVYFFMYNEGHIWGVRCKNNQWYSVDSISGVSPVNLQQLINTKNVGFIIPVNIKTEYYHNIELINEILQTDKHDINQKEKIIKFITQANVEGRVLDNLEIPISICIDILETNMMIKQKNQKYNSSEFLPIQNRIDLYNIFLSQFSNGRYTDLPLIKKYLVPILTQLLH